MTQKSLLSQIGLGVTIRDNLNSQYIGNITDAVTSYQHTIDAVGGFGSATIALSLRKSDAMWWYKNALAKRVRVICDAGVPVYEGFINAARIGSGSVTETIGPVMNIGNRVSVVYSPVSFDDPNPPGGSQMRSLITEDAYSQGLYGILEKSLSIGNADEAAVTLAQQVFLKEGSYPEKSSSISLSPGGAKYTTIEFDCLGLVEWLKAFIYNDLSTGYDTVINKMKLVLAAEPNGYISSDYTLMEDNTIATQLLENQDRFGWDILTELLGLGNDSTDDRRMLGVYEDGKVRYNTIPSSIEYKHLLSDPRQAITAYTSRHSIVPPWLVRPGKWIIVPDFDPNYPLDTSSAYLGIDTRIKFIESVNYSAPLTVDLSGGRTDKLSQLLAKITYSGGLF